ncbi:uracil-DNA glycosylase [Fulvimarina sp. MAC8]|uniref:uracil-DNA glycosylase n=1 Tax=Fulvimarina sp. MAC8 TaxID=3162874 RepID=UPI0032EAD68D
MSATGPTEPPRNCPLCPRLVDFREEWRAKEPGWHNAPVSTFYPEGGAGEVRLLIVGLAPGVRGANRTGRPFTGDYAGTLLYGTLHKHGFANDRFNADPNDGLKLFGTAVTNSVRCVPPENKPVGAEINTCRQFLSATIASLPKLQAIVTLGRIAHDSTVRTLGLKLKDQPFSHGGQLPAGAYTLFPTYHCSRYNTNTGRLTEEMFDKVFANVARFLAAT